MVLIIIWRRVRSLGFYGQSGYTLCSANGSRVVLWVGIMSKSGRCRHGSAMPKEGDDRHWGCL